jgi:protein-L-isoaspartate O-methyltransferase
MDDRRLLPYRQRTDGATDGATDGRVLEIGAGSGLNLRLYPGCVRQVITLELHPTLTRMGSQRVGTHSDRFSHDSTPS